MNKSEFIEKIIKKFMKIFVDTNFDKSGEFILVHEDAIRQFLQISLSECWDMAEKECTVDPNILLKMPKGKHIATLTSQKEEKKNLISLKDMIDEKECENCGTDTEQHTCVDCEQDIPSYICEKYKGMCPHCSWLIGK